MIHIIVDALDIHVNAYTVYVRGNRDGIGFDGVVTVPILDAQNVFDATLTMLEKQKNKEAVIADLNKALQELPR